MYLVTDKLLTKDTTSRRIAKDGKSHNLGALYESPCKFDCYSHLKVRRYLWADFGTDGVRGVANTELTEPCFQLGRAGAYVLAGKPIIHQGFWLGKTQENPRHAGAGAGCRYLLSERKRYWQDISPPGNCILVRKYKFDAGLLSQPHITLPSSTESSSSAQKVISPMN